MNGQGANVTISDVLEGNLVAIFVKVKGNTFSWVIKLIEFTFLVTFGGIKS